MRSSGSTSGGHAARDRRRRRRAASARHGGASRREVVGVKFVETSASDAEFGGSAGGGHLIGAEGGKDFADQGWSDAVGELLAVFSSCGVFAFARSAARFEKLVEGRVGECGWVWVQATGNEKLPNEMFGSLFKG